MVTIDCCIIFFGNKYTDCIILMATKQAAVSTSKRSFPYIFTIKNEMIIVFSLPGSSDAKSEKSIYDYINLGLIINQIRQCIW